MCPERTCEDCLIKLRSKFKGVFEERHNLLNCWQHLPLSQKALSTNVPFLPHWVTPQPWQSPQYPAEGRGRELCSPGALECSSHDHCKTRAEPPAWGAPAEPPA